MAANETGPGLFETVLVFEGRPIELERHLARLAASARELLGAEPSALSIAAEAAAAATGLELARLRIDVAPDAASGSLRHRLEVDPIDPAIFFPPRSRGASLRSAAAPGGVGSHKLADRARIEQLERDLGDEVPLLVDTDGAALEAGRANLFAVKDGRVSTPPADGRILAGTARAVVLEIAAELGIETRERSLTLADLHDADEVFLTSSLRGVRPARRLDGVELGESEVVSRRLAAGLRRRWLGSDEVG